MNEWLTILIMALSGVLFAAGGTHIGKIGGQKWLRRVLLPVSLGIATYYASLKDTEKGKLKPWQLASFLVLLIFLHMGYGERTPYWKKFLIFTGYSAASLFIGFSWWVVITPVVLFLIFLGSNWKPLATTIFWKSWEFMAGVLIALCYISALSNRF
jgi:hypothetical protein